MRLFVFKFTFSHFVIGFVCAISLCSLGMGLPECQRDQLQMVPSGTTSRLAMVSFCDIPSFLLYLVLGFPRIVEEIS